MTEFHLKMITEDLGKSFEDMIPGVESRIQAAVGIVAEQTYSLILEQVQEKQLHPFNRAAYQRGLKIRKLNADAWLITLEDDWATKIEEGFDGYSIKDVLLKSNKIVETGARSGQPWVRKSKDGTKFAAVPFTHQPYSREPALIPSKMRKDLEAHYKTTNLDKVLAKVKAPNMSGEMQKFTQIFHDLKGNPLEGKVARVDVPNVSYLSGITKYQKKYPKVTKSIYMTFRNVSEKSTGWQHPGWKGHKFFEKAEEYVEAELERIVRNFT